MVPLATINHIDRAVDPIASGERKASIEDLLTTLENDLDAATHSLSNHSETLEQLRLFTTTSSDLSSLFTKRGVIICCRYGFDNPVPSACRLALRCCCNILLLSEPTRQMFVDEGYPKRAVELMTSHDPEDEFLSSRLLLLCTYATNLDFEPLFEQQDIAGIIGANISRHAKCIEEVKWESLPTTTSSACNESLKLLYNLSALYPQRRSRFSGCLAPILKLLIHVPISSPPLQPPVTWLINSLVHLDLEKSERDTGLPWPPSSDWNATVDRLILVLELATEAYRDDDMDTLGSPIVQVLLRIAEAPQLNAKPLLQSRLLPSTEERERVLGRGNSLSARLLRLSVAPTVQHLRKLIPALFFELSDKDIHSFVRNIGYGYAAGYLSSEGLEFSADIAEGMRVGDASSSHTRDQPTHTLENERSSVQSFEINPNTGQRRDMESNLQVSEMTDEEKEREAERLFVLFERLRATGVVNVGNPVAQAQQEGRFEELD